MGNKEVKFILGDMVELKDGTFTKSVQMYVDGELVNTVQISGATRPEVVQKVINYKAKSESEVATLTPKKKTTTAVKTTKATKTIKTTATKTTKAASVRTTAAPKTTRGRKKKTEA
jgi:hypothetical protein